MRASTATLAARRALLSGPRSRRGGDSTRDRYGNSPLHKAAVSGACEKLRVLIEHGADMEVG